MRRLRLMAVALFAVGLALAVPTRAAAQSCSASTVRCVDDTAGSTQEYATIQAAVTAAQAGDTVLVYDGTYQGFQVTKSGTASAPILVMAQGTNAVISTPSSTSDGVFLSNVSYVTIQGFKIQNMPQRCVSARNGSPTSPMRGLIVRGNICTNAGREGFYISEVSSSLIEGNTITNTGLDGQTRGHGIYLANAGSDNTTLRGNIISGANAADSALVHLNGDISIGGDGIISGVVIEQNILFNGNQNGISMDGVQSTTIQNNLIYGVSNNGIRGFMIDGAQGPQNMRVINNTVIASSGWAVKFSEDRGGHVIFNNILLTTGSSGAISVGNTNVASDYNAVVNRFSNNDDASTITLSAWQAGGDDTHSFVTTASALFVNASASDYHRRDDSPAVNAGQSVFSSVAAPGADIEGTARPAGAGYDIGAYEASRSGGGGGSTPPRPPTNLRIIR